MTEFNIPGLKEAIKDVEKFDMSIDKTAKSLLDLATNADKAVKSMGVSGLKDAIDLQKQAQKETDKLANLEKRLTELQTDKAKAVAAVNLKVQEAVKANKDWAIANNENATALQKLNAKINETTKDSKELGAQMTLLALDGKKNTVQYKELETQFLKAAEKSKMLNDAYRDISKTAGDNRALVGSYSDELKNHFDSVNEGINSLKGNINSGNFAGAFSDARKIVTGFGQAVKTGTDTTKGINDELGNTSGIFANLKTKVVDTSKATVEFFKPSEENSKKLSEGLERVKIGFTGNNEAVNTLKNSQSSANVVAAETNAINQKGSIASMLYSRAQLALSGATSVAATGFNILKIAIASTGIGLLIIAAGLLVNGLMKMDSVMDGLGQVFAGFGGAIDKATEIVTDFVTNLKGGMDFLSKVGDFFADPIGSIKNFTEQVANSAIAMAKLKESEQNLEDLDKIYDIRNKRIESEIKLLEIKLKNKHITAEQEKEIERQIEANYRQIAANKNEIDEKSITYALEHAKQRKNINQEALENEIRNGEIQYATYLLNADKIDQDTFDKLEKVANAKVDTNTRLAEDEERTQSKIQKAQDRIDAEREKNSAKEIDRQKREAESALRTMKLTLDYKISTYDQATKLDDENLAHIEAISAMKIQIAEAEMRKNLIGVKKGSAEEESIRANAAQEIIKLETEKSKALENVSKNRSKFELSLYDTNTQLILDKQADLTDLLIEEQKNRIKESLQLHKDAMRDELKIDQDTTDEKLKLYEKTGAKLSENETKYLGFIKTQEVKANNDTEKLDKALLDSKLKANSEEEKDSVRKFKLLQKGTLANNKFELKEEEKRLKEDRELYKNNAEQVAKIDLALAENKQKMDTLVKKSKTEGLSESLNQFIEFVGKESELGKAAAIAQATINTYVGASGALKDYPAPYSFIVAALTVANGLKTVAEIEGVQLFAEGTLNAPKGKHIKDELGPEMMFDANWNLLSMGSNKGAHFENLKGGEKIIPADVSAIIRQTMFKSYGMTDREVIDYDRLGSIIGKEYNKGAARIVDAVKRSKTNVNIYPARNMSDRALFKPKNT